MTQYFFYRHTHTHSHNIAHCDPLCGVRRRKNENTAITMQHAHTHTHTNGGRKADSVLFFNPLVRHYTEEKKLACHNAQFSSDVLPVAQFRKAGHENRPLRNTHTHGRDWKNVLLVGSVDGGAMAFTYARLRRQHQPYTHTVPGGFSCFTDREKTLRTRTV